MDAIITKLTGESTKLSDIGIKLLDFKVSSVGKRLYQEALEGRPGAINLGFDFESRDIELKVMFKAVDEIDFPLLRDEIFYWLTEGEFYIQEGRAGDFLIGKRYLVNVADTFSFDQTYLVGETSIDLETVNLPFAESSFTTTTPFTFDAEAWQIGQGLLSDDEPMTYVNNTTSFRIYNAGNVAVNPRYMPLKITLKNLVGTQARIRNTTTGTSLTINTTLQAGDTVKIDGLRVLKNELSILRDTDKGLITLKPGWNQFYIDYLTNTNPNSEFDFRYYYL